MVNQEVTDESISMLIKRLDTISSSERENCWEEIKQLNIDIPKYFLNVYPSFRKWQGRVHLVYHCTKYARTSNDAFQLGIQALSDRATLVRYRAAGILAYSLRKDAIRFLKKNLNHPDKETRKDAERAIRAIKNKNHHIYVEDRADRWIVNEEMDGDHSKVSLIGRIINKISRP